MGVFVWYDVVQRVMIQLSKGTFVALLLAPLVGAGAVFVYFTSPNIAQTVPLFENVKGAKVEEVTFTLTEKHTKRAVIAEVSTSFGWGLPEQEDFRHALSGIQWNVFNEALSNILAEKYRWGNAERELFLIQGTSFSYGEYNLLSRAFAEGEYILSSSHSPAQVAEVLVARVEEEHPDKESFLKERTNEEVQDHVQEFLRGEIELLPDIIPLPPQDVTFKRSNGKDLLAFTTVYYNLGKGPLELAADETTAGISEDIERIIYQRIYKTDGSYRKRPAGIFLWHEEHLHYHFADFAEYRLEATDAPSEEVLFSQKSTFCVRDVSKVVSYGVTDSPANYKICGKERQGVSVGWGDTYFHTYADQSLDVSALPSGRYTLSFIVNPRERFEEISRDNNVSYAVIDIDKESQTAEVVSFFPETTPTIEHVYVD